MDQSPLLANLSFLRVLSLHNNSFHGNIPYQFGTLSRLKMLRLSKSQLEGSIPPTLDSCHSLRNLTLSFNNLIGNISPQLCVLPNLVLMSLAVNNLMGTILDCWGKISSLQYLDLGCNNLHDRVPSKLGMLSELILLNLDDNHLMGRIPSSLSNYTNLEVLDIGGNQLVGHILSELCTKKTTQLMELYLGSNQLSGSVPSSLFNCTKLQLIFLPDNQLSGIVPMELVKLTHPRRLSFGGNYLISSNTTRCPILTTLSNCSNLQQVVLSENNFTGQLSFSKGHLSTKLQYLDLGINELDGEIPPAIGNLSSLTFLSLEEIGKFNKLQAIDTSANQITGYIPSILRSCKEVEYLNLSYNALEGPIPMSISELLSLQDLDLSSNNLSGGIPISLENLTMLHHLNFSFNKLSGEVPKGGVFKKIGTTTFMGNLGLCGPWVNLPPCYAKKHKSVSNLKRVIILVVVVEIVVLCLFLGILWRKNCKRHIQRETDPSLNVGHQRISYAELVIATNEFSDANLLGIGSFGKVYKGILNDDTMVAVKLLNLQNEGAKKSFDKECKVLGRVRQRNLIQVITCYSDLQIKALIFPLMPNGNLE
eukprot:PITA_28264